MLDNRAISILWLAIAAALTGCTSSSQRLTFDPMPLSADRYVKKVEQFLVILDGSSSMGENSHHQKKREIASALLDSLRQTAPEVGYSAGLRSFGHGSCLSGRTRLLFGIEDYRRDGFGQGLLELSCTGGHSPLDLAIGAATTDLSTSGKKAVIIVSDGMAMDHKEVEAARDLKTRHGDNVCIYSVLIGDIPQGRNMLQKITDIGGCGFLVSADELTSDEQMGAYVEKLLLYPDGDGDGVRDQLDRCPDTPAGTEVDDRGCPLDADGDGVPDSADNCPDTPQGVEVDADGCPVDTDGDGVPDYQDACPQTPAGAPVDDRGCPVDTDDDGVFDHLDKCPGTPAGAVVDERGCPHEDIVVRGDTWEIAGKVLFDLNKAVIKSEAQPILDHLAGYLKRNQDIKVEIQGHTDSQGSAKYNQTLSERRAQAAKEYLVGRGVATERLTTVGFGLTKPVVPNDSAENRARNRRVDFKPLR